MEVLDALDYAHNARDMEGRAMQIVHRDISPSNVFISKRGDVKLGDFGIARAQERESKTQAGTLKGKYGYMSPEQVTGGELDGRSDLFAVGIVLAEMLMGRRLFTAPADLDVLLMVRDARTDRLDKYGADLPPTLDRIVRHALDKGPGRALPDRCAVPRRARRVPVRVGQARERRRSARVRDRAVPDRRADRGHGGPCEGSRAGTAEAGSRADASAGSHVGAPSTGRRGRRALPRPSMLRARRRSPRRR